MQSVAVYYVHRQPETFATAAFATGSLCRDHDFNELGELYPDRDDRAEAKAMAIQARLDQEWNTSSNPRSHRAWTNEGRYEALVFDGWPPERFDLSGT